MKTFAFTLTTGVLVFWRAPMLLAEDPSRRSYLFVYAALVAASILLTILTKAPAARVSRSVVLWGGGLLLLIQFSLVRAGLSGTVPWDRVEFELIQWTVLSTIAYLIGRYSQSRATDFEWVRNALVCYVVVNVALVLVGFNSLRAGGPAPAQMLAAMGVGLDRVLFPTAEGFNNFGIIAGAMLVAVAVGLRERPATPAAIIGIPTALFVMLATDSRAALGLAIIVSLVVVGVPRNRLRSVATVTVILVALAPFAMLQWSASLDRDSILDAVSRSDTDLSTFNNRDQIWRGGLSSYESATVTDRLIGYGAFGQVASGATAYYEQIFDGAVELPTLHNALLQYLIDTGVLGTLMFGAFLCAGLWKLSQAAAACTPGARTLFGILIYMVVAGITEVTGTLYHPESLALLIFVTAATATLPFHEKALTVNPVLSRRRRALVA